MIEKGLLHEESLLCENCARGDHMLIMQKMESIHMSENEKHIRDYILSHRDEAVNLTVRELADKIYVSPAGLVVFAKKLGFSGWNEFRQSFDEEQTYLDSHFHDIDANTPFTGKDNVMKIAGRIAVLQQETIADTLSLIRRDRIQKALRILEKTDILYIYGTSMSYMAAREFAYSMKRIGKPVEYCDFQTEQLFQAKEVRQGSSAMVISYTGETSHAVDVCRILKKRKIPVIAVTGIGGNTVRQYSDVCLDICTRENVHSKISTFSTRQSIHTVLDIIYSCFFALSYEGNYRRVIETNRELERSRFSTNSEINK